MGGLTMWIILGGLIGVVVIFLLVTTTLDRKKKKKVAAKKKTLDAGVAASGKNISNEVKRVVKRNEKLLKDFVPSIGKLKMSDINMKSKDALVKLKKSEDFKLLKHIEKEFKSFSIHLNNLIENKSNNWAKGNKADIKFFEDYKFVVPVVTKGKKKNKKGKK